MTCVRTISLYVVADKEKKSLYYNMKGNKFIITCKENEFVAYKISKNLDKT